MENIRLLINHNLNTHYNWDFVNEDPIQIPHKYKKLQDIEITGFFASLFALGNRKIIINKTNLLFNLMDNDPYNFILNFNKKYENIFKDFKHRFFNFEDIIFLISFLQNHYKNNNSLEDAFINPNIKEQNVFNSLEYFYTYILKTPHNKRSEKHISTPLNNSACKRLNLFLRWMVRNDEKKIDFGIWKFIKPSQLIIPLDVHVLSVCNKLKIINSKNANWKTAIEITEFLKSLDINDPIKYDFALMGIGLDNKINKKNKKYHNLKFLNLLNK